MPTTYDGTDGTKRCSRCNRPVEQLPSGVWRCKPCRNEERNDQRRLQRLRAEHVAPDQPTDYDYGDDYAAALADGAIRLSDRQNREALALVVTGAARPIIDRAGISVPHLAAMTGANQRSLYNWIDKATTPKSARAWPAVAAALLDTKTGNDDQDAILRAHDKPPTLQGWRSFQPHPPMDLDRSWQHCDGCARYRRGRRIQG